MSRLCHECCSPNVRARRPEVVTLDASGTCPNCGRFYRDAASLRVRLTPAQASALECAGLEEPLVAGHALIARAWDGDRRLAVCFGDVDALFEGLTDLANAEDASAEMATDVQMAKLARSASRSLTALSGRVIREARAAGWSA